MARKRATEKSPERKKWSNPREMYIYSEEKVTLEQVAKAFGVSVAATANRSAQEGWPARRKRWQAEIQSLVERKLLESAATTKAQMIEEANARHIKSAQEVGAISRGVYGKLLPTIQSEENAGMKVAEGLRVATQMLDKSVTIERKALGLEESIARVQFVKFITETHLEIISKYITDPVIFENIVTDMRELVKKEQEGVEEIINDVVDE